MNSPKRPLLVCILMLAILSLYWYGAEQQSSLVNTNMNWVDQSMYMDYVRKLVESDYTYPGGGNQAPLYPFFQSLIYDSQLSDVEFFTRGKYANLILSIVLLISIFLIIRPRLKWHLTLNLMLIIAFTVFMFKAPYFQAELQFYFLSFVFFLLMLELFSRPSIPLAAITGVVIGLAYLTKASIAPGLLLFLLFITLKGVYQLILQRGSMPVKEAFITNRSLLLVGPLVTFFFLITVYTHIRDNKEIFGSYFYNVNTTFYVWYDSWQEALQGTRAHGDRVGWPEMPPDEIPSLRKYLSEHAPAQILMRFWSGTKLIMKTMYFSYGYLKYVAFYLFLLLLAASWRWQQTGRLLRASPFKFLFVLAYFSAYFLLYSWYVPINPGPRFMMALILPILFVLSRALQSYDFPRSSILPRWLDFLTTVSLLLLAVLGLDIYLIMTQRIAVAFGGW